MPPQTPYREGGPIVGEGGEETDAPSTFRKLGSDGLEGLYRSKAGVFAARLVRHGAGRDDALDFVHDAFVRILGRDSRSRELVERPGPYVATISKNALIDHGRSTNIRKRWVEQEADAVSPHHDQVVYLESRDTLRRLETAITSLKPRTRQIFLARRAEGLSYAEISQLTGMSERAVEKQMSKAIAKLSRLMDRS